MKKIIILLFCFSIKLLGQNNQEKIEIEYIGYEIQIQNKISNILKFQISNMTNDTIYLSEQNFKVQVTKGETILNQEVLKKNELEIQKQIIGSKFTIYKELFEKWVLTKSLREKYSIKLIKKNIEFVNYTNIEKDALKLILSQNCIVLFPLEKNVYVKVFNNSNFNGFCKVELSYETSKAFYSIEKIKKLLK